VAAAATSKAGAKRPISAAARRAAVVLCVAGQAPTQSSLLLDLGAALVPGTVLRRPSERNRSPFVGDVALRDGRVVLAHMPSMDMGGKCVPGAEVLLRLATDKKGNLVGDSAIGQYGTPKCEYIMQLLRVNEPENSAMGGCWIGAHPSIGEKIANALIAEGHLASEIGEVA